MPNSSEPNNLAALGSIVGVASLIFFLACPSGGLILSLYFMPTFVGLGKRNSFAIFMTNLLLGWTFLGWAVALIWACTAESSQQR